MKSKFMDPKKFAKHLAAKGRRRRLRENMRMDDITVIVVDVHPTYFVPVDSKTGEQLVNMNGSNASCYI